MNTQEHLQTLNEIRDLMNKSSRFLSLSGLSGIGAGVSALIGAAVAYWHLGLYFVDASVERKTFLFEPGTHQLNYDFLFFCVADAFCVLIAAVGTALYFTNRQARRKGQPIWNDTAKRLLINLLIPLAAGGVFCLALLYHGMVPLVAPAMLIFYGLSLLNGSKYTLHDIRYLAITEICLGLVSAFLSRYGLLFWTIGFGFMHIIYGTVMYYKYER